MKPMARDKVAAAFACLAILALAVSGFHYWREWQRFSARKTMVPAEGAGLGAADCASQRRDLEERNQLAEKRLVYLQTTLGVLRRKQMPLEPAATRELQLELLTLAHRCGLAITEVSRVTESTQDLLADGAEAPAPARNSGDSGAAKQRPRLRLQCQASFQETSRFLDGLRGLKWMVTPLSLQIDRAGQTTVMDEDDGLGSMAAGPGPSDRNSLAMSVVLAF